MSNNTTIVTVACIFFSWILLMFVQNSFDSISKAKAGLQECVIVTPSGHTHILWQKECK